jgi:hypothetical protein
MILFPNPECKISLDCSITVHKKQITQKNQKIFPEIFRFKVLLLPKIFDRFLKEPLIQKILINGDREATLHHLDYLVRQYYTKEAILKNPIDLLHLTSNLEHILKI